MGQVIYLFTGAGNNFVVLDGRGADMTAFRQADRIQQLCREYATDGLMILGDARLVPGMTPMGTGMTQMGTDMTQKGAGVSSGIAGGTDNPTPDFVMEFYNPDGSGGMMCGNGGRCIVAFADLLGLKPASADGTWHFLAPDGPHEARILGQVSSKGRDLARVIGAGEAWEAQNTGEVPAQKLDLAQVWTVRLKMIDVEGVTPMKGGYFLNTGTRHLVLFVDDVEAVDMERDAKPLRWDMAFQPEGTNVNFVQVAADGLHVRTFEKGVEGETLACGTGLTASALAAWHKGVPPQEIPGQAGNDGTGTDPVMPGPDQASYRLQCRRGDWLEVACKKQGGGYTDVYLTGPAELVQIIQ